MSANIKNENIDLTSILKDVENCIRSGLSNKLDTFFYEYDKYKKTHEEVLNLSIVKELLKNSSSTLSRSSEDTKPKLDPELEMIVLRNQVMYLRGEVNKYKSQVEEQSQRQTKIVTIKPEYSHINLEVKEEEREPLDIKSENEDEDEDEDGDISIASDSSDTSDSSDNNSIEDNSIEDNIQNIVLNVTEKDERNVEEDDHHEEEVEVKEVEVDSEEEEEEDKEEEEEEEEEDADEDEEEDEDIVVKMPTFPTKKVDEVKSIIEETKTEEQEQEEEEVETETEEDSDEEKATEATPDMKTLEVKVETETKTEVVQDEEEEEEEEEEELYEVEINGVMYVTNDDEDGTIYSYIDEEVGDKVGEFKGLVAHIYNGKNKGIYDRTKCKLNF